MPIIAHTSLPTFQRLRNEGQEILPLHRAAKQDFRELHIGLLNMMPDPAIEATERQFLRLIGAANLIAQFHVHLFTIDSIPRNKKIQAHIEAHYEPFSQIKRDGLDALIITGAAPTAENLEDESFWSGLIEVIDWAKHNVTSTLCSCLASHAIIHYLWQQKRQPLGFKRWGVYPHRVLQRSHPLVADINTRFDVPHSRYNEITQEQLTSAGLVCLVASPEAGVHLAVSPDQFRIVFFQGHPEYDKISLLKEYKREVILWFQSQRSDYPPFPTHFFRKQAIAILNEYQMIVTHAKNENHPFPEFPDALLSPLLDNTWRDTAKAIISNWLGKVYQLTNNDRSLPFMQGISPDDPLNLHKVR